MLKESNQSAIGIRKCYSSHNALLFSAFRWNGKKKHFCIQFLRKNELKYTVGLYTVGLDFGMRAGTASNVQKNR